MFNQYDNLILRGNWLWNYTIDPIKMSKNKYSDLNVWIIQWSLSFNDITLSKILENVEEQTINQTIPLNNLEHCFCNQSGTYEIGIKSLLNCKDVPDI